MIKMLKEQNERGNCLFHFIPGCVSSHGQSVFRSHFKLQFYSLSFDTSVYPDVFSC